MIEMGGPHEISPCGSLWNYFLFLFADQVAVPKSPN
jgi:hypothetical protein